MKYVFFGTPEFARIILEKLLDACMPPVAVVTNPDKPVGRKKVITPPPVKARIMNYDLRIGNKIKILQPEKLDPSLFLNLNSSIDLFVVAAYAKILPKEILSIPRLGSIGIHPSLLPKYRGTTPIQTAILNGEKETGVTLFLLNEKVDNGKILAQAVCPIGENDTYETLLRKLAARGGVLLAETILGFADRTVIPREQEHAHATYTKKFSSEDGYINPEILKDAENGGNNAVVVYRKIRALNPEPGVYTFNEQKKRVKLLEAAIVNNKLELKKIQLEGKKPVIM